MTIPLWFKGEKDDYFNFPAIKNKFIKRKNVTKALKKLAIEKLLSNEDNQTYESISKLYNGFNDYARENEQQKKILQDKVDSLMTELNNNKRIDKKEEEDEEEKEKEKEKKKKEI